MKQSRPIHHRAPLTHSTHTLLVHRLSYPELWRLAQGGLFAFAVLLRVKWFKSAQFDHTITSPYRTALLNDPVLPAILQDRFTAARAQYEALGFRYLGTDADGLRVNGCLAHFLRGPVVAIQVIAARLNYATLMSFPRGAKPINTANGRGVVDGTALHDWMLLPRLTRIAALTEQHLTRIAPLGLPDLTEETALDALEQLARDAQAHQVARGVFIMQSPAPVPPGK